MGESPPRSLAHPPRSRASFGEQSVDLRAGERRPAPSPRHRRPNRRRTQRVRCPVSGYGFLGRHAGAKRGSTRSCSASAAPRIKDQPAAREPETRKGRRRSASYSNSSLPIWTVWVLGKSLHAGRACRRSLRARRTASALLFTSLARSGRLLKARFAGTPSPGRDLRAASSSFRALKQA